MPHDEKETLADPKDLSGDAQIVLQYEEKG
jgi:hypothetical protein